MPPGRKIEKGLQSLSGAPYEPIVFNEIKTMTTSDPATTSTSEGTATVINECTHTWTPGKATNRHVAKFQGAFTNVEKKPSDGSVFGAFFLNGTKVQGTEGRVYIGDGYPASLTLNYEDTGLSVASQTLDVRFWNDTGDEIVCDGLNRSYVLREFEDTT